ncbi:MAG: hypothetical protein HY908_11920, partial [Myxococcales bacterium]|nr:hypothetical protein [Myxococcales bacterium]
GSPAVAADGAPAPDAGAASSPWSAGGAGPAPSPPAADAGGVPPEGTGPSPWFREQRVDLAMLPSANMNLAPPPAAPGGVAPVPAVVVPPRSTSPLLYVALGIAAVALIGVIVYLAVGGRKGGDSDPESVRLAGKQVSIEEAAASASATATQSASAAPPPRPYVPPPKPTKRPDDIYTD